MISFTTLENVITIKNKEDYEMVSIILSCGKDLLSLADMTVSCVNLTNHEVCQIPKTPRISGGVRCC